MIYLCAALHLLGGVLAIALIFAYEEVEGHKTSKGFKITMAMTWPLLAIVIVLMPNKLVVK